MIDYQRKIVVVHPPRCGGTSIERAMLGGDLFHSHPFEKHLNARELAYHLRARGERPADYRWYGLIRSPLERLQSMYRSGHWRPYIKCHAVAGHRFGFATFCALVRPALHERDNLSLSDYLETDEVQIELLSPHDIDGFIERYTGQRGERSEVSQGPAVRVTLAARLVAYQRFRRDYLRYFPEEASGYGSVQAAAGLVIVRWLQLANRVRCFLRVCRQRLGARDA